jgi:AcrR family transcriptional regulator
MPIRLRSVPHVTLNQPVFRALCWYTQLLTKTHQTPIILIIDKPSVGLRKKKPVSRTVNVQDYAEKRNAILDVAERYIVTKGFEEMTTQDILQELQISRGAFYHYFESKQALLPALVERIGQQATRLVLPVVSDPELSAPEKLVRFFVVLDQQKRANLDVLFEFLRIWYADENALFRQKLYLARIQRLSPLLSQIIAQGVAEDDFTTPYPNQAARIIISLLEDLAYATVDVLLTDEGPPGDVSRISRIDISRLTEISLGTADAIERVLGMEPGYLRKSWSEHLLIWQALFA